MSRVGVRDVANRVLQWVGVRMEGDANYFIRRANEERIASMKAVHPKARSAHLEMAERYDEFAAAIVSHDLRARPEAVASRALADRDRVPERQLMNEGS